MYVILQDSEKNKAFEWTNESEMAFQKLKEYLGSPSLLMVQHGRGAHLIFVHVAYCDECSAY